MTIMSDIDAGVTTCDGCDAGYGSQGSLKQFTVRLDLFRRVHTSGACATVEYEPLNDTMTCRVCGVSITMDCYQERTTTRMGGFAQYHHQHCGGAS